MGEVVKIERRSVTGIRGDTILIPTLEVAKQVKRAWLLMINPKYWFTEGKRVIDAIELICPDERFWDWDSDYYEKSEHWLGYIQLVYNHLFFAYCYSHLGIRDANKEWERMKQIWDELHFEGKWLKAVEKMKKAVNSEETEYGLRIVESFEDELKALVRDELYVAGSYVGDIKFAATVKAPTAEEMFWKEGDYPHDAQGTAIGDYGLVLLVNTIRNDIDTEAVNWALDVLKEDSGVYESAGYIEEINERYLWVMPTVSRLI